MGVTLPYERWGSSGPVVVMLHGFTGNRTVWRHLEPQLGGRLRAVAVDLPGHGAAALPGRTGREGWEETLDGLERVLDELRVPQVDLLGYSQGARVALGLAMRAGSRIRRLILESGNPGLRRRRDRTIRRLQDEELARSIEAGGVETFLDRWERLPLFAGMRTLPMAVQHQIRERRQSGSVQGYAGALRCMGLGVQPSYWDELPMLRVPTLLLTGARDTKFTELARKMTRELPQVWHRAFEGCGHAPHLEATEEYAQEVLGFLGAPWTDPEHDHARDLRPLFTPPGATPALRH